MIRLRVEHVDYISVHREPAVERVRDVQVHRQAFLVVRTTGWVRVETVQALTRVVHFRADGQTMSDVGDTHVASPGREAHQVGARNGRTRFAVIALTLQPREVGKRAKPFPEARQITE